jgi:DNA-directed RNA polymerase specialized sigma24 family protein
LPDDYREVAARMGKTVDSVKKLLARGLARLRNLPGGKP